MRSELALAGLQTAALLLVSAMPKNRVIPMVKLLRRSCILPLDLKSYPAYPAS